MPGRLLGCNKPAGPPEFREGRVSQLVRALVLHTREGTSPSLPPLKVLSIERTLACAEPPHGHDAHRVSADVAFKVRGDFRAGIGSELTRFPLPPAPTARPQLTAGNGFFRDF